MQLQETNWISILQTTELTKTKMIGKNIERMNENTISIQIIKYKPKENRNIGSYRKYGIKMEV